MFVILGYPEVHAVLLPVAVVNAVIYLIVNACGSLITLFIRIKAQVKYFLNI
jgi:hypothetical protein